MLIKPPDYESTLLPLPIAGINLQNAGCYVTALPWTGVR
jgi:hypothetical protein